MATPLVNQCKTLVYMFNQMSQIFTSICKANVVGKHNEFVFETYFRQITAVNIEIKWSTFGPMNHAEILVNNWGYTVTKYNPLFAVFKI